MKNQVARIFVSLLVIQLSDISLADHCETCKSLSYLNYFPTDALQGVWYYTTWYDGSDEFVDCAQIKFTKDNCTSFKTEFCSYSGGNQISCEEGTLTSLDQTNPDGRALFVKNPPLKRYEIYLLDLVEDYYAVVYGCKTFNDDTKFEEYFLLTQYGEIYKNDGTFFQQLFTNFGLDTSLMKMVPQGDQCEYLFKS